MVRIGLAIRFFLGNRGSTTRRVTAPLVRNGRNSVAAASTFGSWPVAIVGKHRLPVKLRVLWPSLLAPVSPLPLALRGLLPLPIVYLSRHRA
mgnify:CR=1 FL=1